MWRLKVFLGLLFSAAFIVALPGLADAAPTDSMEVRLMTSQQSVSPGETIKVGVEFKIPAGSHIYFKEAGDSGRPTSVDLTLPDGTHSTALIWPRPLRFEEEGLVCFGYKDKVVLAFEVTVPKNQVGNFPIAAKVTWLNCGHGSCIPGDAKLSAELPLVQGAGTLSTDAVALEFEPFNGAITEIGDDVAASATVPAPAVVLQAKTETLSLPYALLLSFAAGLLLNLMPCVLPVLALKVLGFAKQAGQDRAANIRLGLAYTLGTVATFFLMATAIVTARALGTSLGWGFQFQSLTYLVGMCSMICLMTLSLFGLFYVQIQTGLQSLDQVGARNGLISAFARGISATLLSTPCSAPLLGTALGFALSQSGLWIYAVLLSVGFGLAAPYLLLSCFPSWLRFIPKPGEWMERFKEAMGFLMLGTMVWMLYVIAQVGGAAALVGTLFFLFTLTVSAWFYVRFGRESTSLIRKTVVIALALLLTGWSFHHNVWNLSASVEKVGSGLEIEGVRVEAYSAEKLQHYLAEGKVVLLDGTAEWCLTCKINERVLTASSVREAMLKHNVVILQADFTRGDEKVGALIRSFGRPGVPLYVVYSPHGKTPVLLPEIITPAMVTDAIREASK